MRGGIGVEFCRSPAPNESPDSDQSRNCSTDRTSAFQYENMG
jgi:hypothetical protein